MKKKTIPVVITPVITGVITGLLLSTQWAAHAAGLIDLDGYFQNAWGQFNSLLHEAISENYDPEVAALLQRSVNQALGTLGIPDPTQVALDLDRRLIGLPPGDITQPVPITRAAIVARDFNRELLRQQATTVLGQGGQQATQARAQQIANTVWQSQAHADAALAAISTQETIKQMAQLQARQTDLLGGLHSDLMQSRQDAAIHALALADISETLDQQWQAEQLERRAEVVNSLQQAALARLF